MTNSSPWNITMLLIGKQNHLYFYGPFSMAMLNNQRVSHYPTSWPKTTNNFQIQCIRNHLRRRTTCQWSWVAQNHAQYHQHPKFTWLNAKGTTITRNLSMKSLLLWYLWWFGHDILQFGWSNPGWFVMIWALLQHGASCRLGAKTIQVAQQKMGSYSHTFINYTLIIIHISIHSPIW